MNNDERDPPRADPIGDISKDPLGEFAGEQMSADRNQAEGCKQDNQVGYRRPPKSRQWKPGQSGNPRGRRREADEDRNLYDAFNDLLDDSVRLKNGQTLSGEEIMAEQIMAAASKGDPRAFREFIRLCRRAKFFERLATGPRLPEGMRPDDFIKGQIEELRRKLDKLSGAALQKVVSRQADTSCQTF